MDHAALMCIVNGQADWCEEANDFSSRGILLLVRGVMNVVSECSAFDILHDHIGNCI